MKGQKLQRLVMKSKEFLSSAEDYLSDIMWKKLEILEPFLLEVGDIEGRGWAEFEWSIVTDYDNEELYRGESY